MKNIIITGASGNLGEVVVAAFKSADYFLNLVIRQAYEDTERIRAWQADLTDAKSVAKLVEDITHADPQIDAVIHLVGGYAPGKLDHTGLSELDKMIDINFKSAFILFQEILLLPVFVVITTGINHERHITEIPLEADNAAQIF